MSETQNKTGIEELNLDQVQEVLKHLEVRRHSLIGQGLSSSDPHEIMKAQGILELIEKKQENNRKSIIVDPSEFSSSFGYKEKPIAMSYNMLKNMSKVPVINAIIKTRINQVAAFCEPQKDKYSMGFIVRKKRKYGEEESQMTDAEKKEANRIIDFIMNCGDGFSFEGDQDFDTFTRKVMWDSLVYDQMTWENSYDRRGLPYAFYATDAATIRVADSFDDETYVQNKSIWASAQRSATQPLNMRKSIKGYFPSYVQVFQSEPIAAFYPWELCFGVRNPTSSIHDNGYGHAELEELVTVVTSIIWGEEYNRRFFKQGSIPKGLLRVSGQINDTKLQEFKREWNATMRGVYNAWKTPILEGDKVEWVDLQKSNRDMEYHAWIEFLIKTACAIFSIDPSEVNFDISSGGAGGKSAFEGNSDKRVNQSKVKGLYPLLKFYQTKLNRHIVYPLNPEFELVFMGMDGTDADTELDRDIKRVQYYVTVNELRREKGMKDVEGGDIILNSVFASSIMQKQQMDMMNQAGANSEEGESMFDMKGFAGDDGDPKAKKDGEEVNPETEEDDAPIQKAYEDYIKKLTL